METEGKTTCECGGTYNKNNKWSKTIHEKTKKHTTYVFMKNTESTSNIASSIAALVLASAATQLYFLKNRLN